MVNNGSSVSATQVVNFEERLQTIREGQIKMYAYDAVGGVWARSPLVPYPPSPLTSVFHNVLPLPDHTAPAVQFPSRTCNTAIIRASGNNADVVYLGGNLVSDVNGYELEPGEAVIVCVSNLNLLYAIPTVDNDSLRWLVVI